MKGENNELLVDDGVGRGHADRGGPVGHRVVREEDEEGAVGEQPAAVGRRSHVGSVGHGDGGRDGKACLREREAGEAEQRTVRLLGRPERNDLRTEDRTRKDQERTRQV